MSRLLSRLDAEIAAGVAAHRRGELLARKAGYLSRIGDFAQAESILHELRGEFGDGRSPSVSIWMMLAEGLFHAFKDDSALGADRITRASALASATKDRQMIAATSAWRAHIQSERSEFKGMVRSLETAFLNAGDNDHEALARAYMTQANALMSCGERPRAQGCYMRARHHALEAGDQAAIDALLYNKAAFGVAWLRARACFDEHDPDGVAHLRRELASSRNFQGIAHATGVEHWLYLWEARLAVLAGEFEAALKQLRSVRSQGHFPPHTFRQQLIDLEIAYCLLRLERRREAEEAYAEAKGFNATDIHEDEQLVAAWVRCALSEAGIGDEQFQVLRDDLAARLETFDNSMVELREVLSALRDAPGLGAQGR